MFDNSTLIATNIVGINKNWAEFILFNNGYSDETIKLITDNLVIDDEIIDDEEAIINILKRDKNEMVKQ